MPNKASRASFFRISRPTYNVRPTDAAGGYADGDTYADLKELGISVDEALKNNDSYNALIKTGGLVFTGPTGTNVNDVAIGLIAAE
ncbi:MAG: hypothetical protein IJL71_00990 [Oscillospiraceae bacterium]|nr:hypothetical protein [Oscillospiraceae bacterium]